MAKITEELVAEACAYLRSIGENVSVKAVQEQIGGSTNDVATFVKAWKMANPEEEKPFRPKYQHQSQQEPDDDDKIIIPAISDLYDAYRGKFETLISSQIKRERLIASESQRRTTDECESKIASLSTAHADVIASLTAAHVARLELTEKENIDLLNDKEALQAGVAALIVKNSDEKSALLIMLEKAEAERNAARENNASLTVQLTNERAENEVLIAANSQISQHVDVLVDLTRKLEQAETKAISERDNALAEIARLRPFESEAAAQRQRGDDLDKEIDKVIDQNIECHNSILNNNKVLLTMEQRQKTLVAEVATRNKQLENATKQLELAYEELEKMSNVVTTERYNAERANDKIQFALTASQKETAGLGAEIIRLNATIVKLEHAAAEICASHQLELSTVRAEHKQMLDAFKIAISELKSAQSVNDEVTSSVGRHL